MTPETPGDILTRVQKDLSGTRFSCSSLEPLTGGGANFTFKGLLREPLPDGTEHVILKHGEGFLSSDPNFKVTTARCLIEQECLKAVTSLPPVEHSNFAIRTPQLLHFSHNSNTQVQQLLPHALNLKLYCLKHFSDGKDAKLKPECLAIGQALGKWLRQFHSWASSPDQAGLRQMLESSREMQQLKKEVNYDRLVATVQQFPSLRDALEILEKVRAMADAELDDPEQLRVIHGDFWTGNALLPDRALESGTHTPIFIVDWELAQVGTCPLDLGQMIAEMYELYLFKEIDAGKWLVEGFMTGYGHEDDSFAFRTAIHVGVHLVCWGSSVPGWGTEDQVQQVVAVGKEIVVRAWLKDRAWFEAGDLACLLEQVPAA